RASPDGVPLHSDSYPVRAFPDRERTMFSPRHGARGVETRAPTAGSDPAALGRTASVVRHRGDILDGADLQTGGLQRADRGLTTRARALDENGHLASAVLQSPASGGLGRDLSGVRGRLARTLEADLPGAGRRNHGTGGVGDADHRVVERALDVSMSMSDIFLFLATHLAWCGTLAALGRHE